MRCTSFASVALSVLLVLASACGGESRSAPTGSGGESGAAGATGSGGAGFGGMVTTASGLPVAPGGAAVPQPSGTPGNLTVLPWAGFKAAVSYTFDDGSSSVVNSYAALNALGVHFTFYLVTGWGGASASIWPQAVTAGHELGNHTKTHPEAASETDIDAATTFIQTTYGVTPYTFAAPYGNGSYVDPAKARFLVNRGVSNGLVGPMTADDTNMAFNLPCYIPPTAAAASVMDGQVDEARTAGKWKIVLVHGFTGDSSAWQPVDLAEFTATVNHAKSLGDVWIDSMVNVAAYWRGHNAFNRVTPTISGSSKTWTWTLPAHFPPGKFLRVKVDGGTLTQNGTTLAWDPHGFYEVALDAGSLTLSP